MMHRDSALAEGLASIGGHFSMYRVTTRWCGGYFGLAAETGVTRMACFRVCKCRGFSVVFFFLHRGNLCKFVRACTRPLLSLHLSLDRACVHVRVRRAAWGSIHWCACMCAALVFMSVQRISCRTAGTGVGTTLTFGAVSDSSHG